MFTLKKATILALVGSTFATPIAHWGGYNRNTDGSPISGRLPGTYGYDHHSGDKVVVVIGTPTDQAASTTAAAVVVATTSAATVSSDTTGSSSSGTGYMATVSKWRSAMGLSALTQSSKLEANALKTANDGNGQMVHELNPGSFGQVLAPGTASNFESVFVGGWLCELPNMKGLNGICTTMTKGWSHDGQTGHAEILSSTNYKSIGCALAKGIWACDVA